MLSCRSVWIGSAPVGGGVLIEALGQMEPFEDQFGCRSQCGWAFGPGQLQGWCPEPARRPSVTTYEDEDRSSPTSTALPSSSSATRHGQLRRSTRSLNTASTA